MCNNCMGMQVLRWPTPYLLRERELWLVRPGFWHDKNIILRWGVCVD
jgi:hypothetical protein